MKRSRMEKHVSDIGIGIGNKNENDKIETLLPRARMTEKGTDAGIKLTDCLFLIPVGSEAM